GRHDIKTERRDDIEEQTAELDTLPKADITLDLTEYAHLMNPLYDALLDYPHEMDTEKEPGKPSDSAVHDYLVDVLEAEVVEVETQAGIDETVEDAQYQEVE